MLKECSLHLVPHRQSLCIELDILLSKLEWRTGSFLDVTLCSYIATANRRNILLLNHAPLLTRNFFSYLKIKMLFAKRLVLFLLINCFCQARRLLTVLLLCFLQCHLLYSECQRWGRFELFGTLCSTVFITLHRSAFCDILLTPQYFLQHSAIKPYLWQLFATLIYLLKNDLLLLHLRALLLLKHLFL